MAGKTVDQYIAGLDQWQADIVTELRDIVRKAAPEAKESFKWAQPVYETNGPFCYMKAFKNAVNFGFWRGVEIADPQGVLQGTGEKMRHVKIKEQSEINRIQLAEFVKQAVQLNLDKGDPTKS